MILIELDTDADTERAIAETIESMLGLLPYNSAVSTGPEFYPA